MSSEGRNNHAAGLIGAVCAHLRAIGHPTAPDGIGQAVLTAYARSVDRKKGDRLAWPGVPTLAHRAGFGETAIKSARTRLLADGWLRLVKPVRGGRIGNVVEVVMLREKWIGLLANQSPDDGLAGSVTGRQTTGREGSVTGRQRVRNPSPGDRESYEDIEKGAPRPSANAPGTRAPAPAPPCGNCGDYDDTGNTIVSGPPGVWTFTYQTSDGRTESLDCCAACVDQLGQEFADMDRETETWTNRITGETRTYRPQ